jgi:hypothetical protein
MTIKKLAVIPAILAVSACGGGGGGGSASAPTAETLKTYNDGSGVLAAEEVDLSSAGGITNIQLVSEDNASAREIVEGTINLTVVDGSAAQDGAFYQVSRTGTGSNGSSVKVATVGENLNYSGTEYASLSIVTIDGDVGLASGGTPVKGIPAGSFTYSGAASVIEPANLGDGTFTMSANFDNNTGSIAATIPENSIAGSNNPEYFFSANDLSINQNDGSFSSPNARIGEQGVTSDDASINGYFAGTNASGVHGLVYTDNSESPTYVGGFRGSR